VRSDKVQVSEELLRALYGRCDGYAQRVHEILEEEHHIRLGYSTLTRLLGELGIGRVQEVRHEHYPDTPGEEMQHDTSVYNVRVGDSVRRIVCCGLYYRYSKMRYIRFYPRFDRFRLKCFLHEALGFYGVAARMCVVDNSSVVLLHGSGDQAVFAPEMEAFGRQYGFHWKAHALGHADRKAGEERAFFTLETNFFPGRSFRDLQDLNRQALQWASVRFASRPLSHTRLVPRQLFEEERPYLLKIPDGLPAPYRDHRRHVDPYGFVSFEVNYYWVPEKVKGEVELLEYDRKIEIYQHRRKLIDYPLPPWGVRNQAFSPEDRPPPGRRPNNRHYETHEERLRLTQKGPCVVAYLAYIDSACCQVRYKQKLVRDLYRLSTKLAPEVFLAVIERAVRHRIDSLASLERIAVEILKQEIPASPSSPWSVTDGYEERESYQMGRFSSEADPSHLNRLSEEPVDD
jgi:hypothetical protein